MSPITGEQAKWKMYPVDSECYAPAGVDRDLCRRRLFKDSPRLFTETEEGFEMIRGPKTDCDREWHPQRLNIRGADISRELTQTKDQDCFLLVPQEFSWGRFRLTRTTFISLLSCVKVFTPFLDFVHAFGQKTNDDQNTKDTCYQILWNTVSGDPSNRRYEVCYNLRYVEENGRGRGDPWSLRQVGVYQTLDVNTGRSIWIILRPTSYLIDQLNLATKDQLVDTSVDNRDPLRLHTVFLAASRRNWEEHVASLKTALNLLGEKAYYSNAGEKTRYDYDVCFTDAQDAHSLCNKLQRISLILEGSVTTSSTLLAAERQLRKSTNDSACTDTCNGIIAHIEAIQHCKRNVDHMAGCASKTVDMLSSILATRGGVNVQETMRMMQDNLNNMQVIAMQTQRENGRLLDLAQQGQEDARVLKVLTQVTTMYLPASLIASIFSTSLVNDGFSSMPPLALYFTITVPLLAATLFLLLWLDRGRKWATQRKWP